jgi:hypothetical protein
VALHGVALMSSEPARVPNDVVDLKSAIFTAGSAQLASKHGSLQNFVAERLACRLAPMGPWVRPLFEKLIGLA